MFSFASVCILAIGESSSPWLSFITIFYRWVHLIYCAQRGPLAATLFSSSFTTFLWNARVDGMKRPQFQGCSRPFQQIPARSEPLLWSMIFEKLPTRAESVPQPRLTITTTLGLLELDSRAPEQRYWLAEASGTTRKKISKAHMLFRIICLYVRHRKHLCFSAFNTSMHCDFLQLAIFQSTQSSPRMRRTQHKRLRQARYFSETRATGM